MLPLLVWCAAIFLLHFAHSLIEDRCCCGCPFTPCPLTLSKECLADASTPCFRSHEFNSSKTVVNCRVLLNATVSTTFDKDYEFVPIGKDSEQGKLASTPFQTNSNFPRTPFNHGQDSFRGGAAMRDPSLVKSFMPTALTGGPYDALGINVPMSAPQYGWGNDVGNLVGRIIDSVRDFVGATLSGPIAPYPLYPDING